MTAAEDRQIAAVRPVSPSLCVMLYEDNIDEKTGCVVPACLHLRGSVAAVVTGPNAGTRLQKFDPFLMVNRERLQQRVARCSMGQGDKTAVNGDQET